MQLITQPIPLHQISSKGEKIFFDFIEWGKKENTLEWDKKGQAYDASFPHRHQYYEVIFFDEGEGIHEIDFVPHFVKSPSIHFLPLGKVHKTMMNAPYSGFSLLFSSAFFPEDSKILSQMSFFQHQNASPILFVNEQEYAQIKAWVMEIKAAWQHNAKDKWEWIRVHLSLILMQSQRLYQNDSPQTYSHRSEVIQKFVDLVEVHHLEHWILQKYADQLSISEPYLNALCKKECGMSASNLIQERLTQSAKRKLVYTTNTIKSVAFELNFNDPSYFIRFFKKQVGMSPNAYRQQISKDI